ncbi:inositol monophosphatase family protein [Pelagibacterium lentulum]|uniref:Inositol-1-monophosphatase n=1 Tax=Pelagibacterium lentulum TaxID=2029865 RepID=A0A916R6X0_9HYPH|nr:inositol monophosphatase [Pelagibacterium lentulum]GGA38711.1 inositol monophosphatase [Pelagibacterium lentulum]
MIKPISNKGIAERLVAAKETARNAGTLALDYFARYQTLDIDYKTSRQDAVTIADQAVETHIRNAIFSVFPEDGIIGEEHGVVPGSSGYDWIIDPIDGTAAFLHGLSSWSVVIALLENGKPVAGLVYEACADRLYWAEAGGGAYCNENRLVIPPTAFDAGLTVIAASRPEHADHTGSIIAQLLKQGGAFMRSGSAALALAHVGAGHYVGFYEPRLSAWDCLAGLLIVSEAGGDCDDWLALGAISNRHPCLAGNKVVAPILRTIIAKAPGINGA